MKDLEYVDSLKNPTNVIIEAWHNELKANLKRTKNVFIMYEQRLINEHQRMRNEFQRTLKAAYSVTVNIFRKKNIFFLNHL